MKTLYPKIITYLNNHDCAGSEAMGRYLGVSYSTARNHMEALIVKGHLVKDVGSRGGNWKAYYKINKRRTKMFHLNKPKFGGVKCGLKYNTF